MGSRPHGEILSSNENKCIVSTQDNGGGGGGSPAKAVPVPMGQEGRQAARAALRRVRHSVLLATHSHSHTHCEGTKLHTPNLQLPRHTYPISIKLLPKTGTDEDLVVIGLHKRGVYHAGIHSDRKP